MEKKPFREIAVFVTGMTPQIITETLYALTQQADPPVIPDEVCVITTAKGKAHLKERLLKSGVWDTFFAEYDLSPIQLNADSFFVVKDSEGKSLEDIRSEGENESLGNLISDIIREKTSDNRTRLHCSIAGGRKTMSYYLGSALQLFARPWDRLYHVLVTPEFESHQGFYYIPKENRTLEISDRQEKVMKKIQTKDACIELADLPFIRLREKIPLNGKSFRELVVEGQQEIDTARRQEPLSIDLREKTIRIGNEFIDLIPMEMLIYVTFIRAKLEGCEHPESPYCLTCTDCFLYLSDLTTLKAVKKMAVDYDTICGPMSARMEEFDEKWIKKEKGLEDVILRQNRSKINRAIKEQLKDNTMAPYYEIAAVGRHGKKRYGIRVEKGKIRIGGGRRDDV